MNQTEARRQHQLGMKYALLCTILWAVLVFYWQALRPINSWVIILYRILLVGVVCFLAALKTQGWQGIKAPLAQKGAKLKFFLAGALITANWSIYIWAVNADHVIQTSIGYYIEPLIICLFGILVFKEKLTRHKAIALSLAAIGILIVLIHFGEIPFIALSLGVTFAIYAAVKKSVSLPAVLSLLYETMFFAPFALVIILYLEFTGRGAVSAGAPYQWGLILMVGVVTAIPLGLFAGAANRIPMISLGIMEYITPSISLVFGIFLLREPFDRIQLLAFAAIWAGLAIFTWGEVKEYRERKSANKENPPQATRQPTEESHFYDCFGPTHDRLSLPKGVVRVTGARGGESTLIPGTEKTALVDCGMAYCGSALVENIKRELKGRPLDYIFLSHTHYDHIGGLPALRKAFPSATTFGAAYGQKVLQRPGALNVIKELSIQAGKDYGDPKVNWQEKITTEGMSVDKVVKDGDRISLGAEEMVVLETKGHTDCSLTFVLEPMGLMFASESTGILEALDYVHTSILKSYGQSMESLEKCRSYAPKDIILPHFGRLPRHFNETYWNLFLQCAQEELAFLRTLHEENQGEEAMLRQYMERYWTPEKEAEQPKAAFEANAKAIIKAMQREFVT